MIPLLEFQERSLRGPVMTAQKFDIAFSLKVRELVEKYGITFDPKELIVDDATADAVFQAGVDLLAASGLYQLDTQRVIEYTREEILAFAAERKAEPARVVMGRGQDEMLIAYRTSDDTRPPALYTGVAGAISEEEFVPLMTAFVREPRIEGLGIAGGISKVGEVVPKVGTLTEVYCGHWEQDRLREVLEREGRPGMSLGLLCTVSTPSAIMECVDGEFRGPHNTHIGVHIIPEQKINWERLLLAHFCEHKGIVPWQSAMSLLGGLCRDAADAAISLVANVLGQMSYGHGPICSLFPNHLDGTWATPSCMWATSAAARAAERNIGLAMGSCPIASYQWGATPISVMQTAAQCLTHTKSGVAYIWLGGGPREAVLGAEIMEAACRMSRDEALALANRILARIEALALEVEPRSRVITFRDVYDLERIEPLESSREAFERGKRELLALGVPLA